MDDGTMVKDPLALSIRLAREERHYMSTWLALEVLMTDETVRRDTDLFDRLSRLQEKLEKHAVAKYGTASTGRLADPEKMRAVGGPCVWRPGRGHSHSSNVITACHSTTGGRDRRVPSAVSSAMIT